MARKSIDVIIAPTGETTIEAVGYTGKTCTEATKFLTKALGKISKEVKTADYHKPAQTRISQRQ